MKKILSGIILVIFLSNTFLVTVGAEAPIAGTLTVSGSYTVVDVADEAYVTIGVKTANADYKLCQEENKVKINSITAAIKSLGVEERYIKTIDYKSTAIYEYIKTNEYTGIYYNGTYYNKRVFKGYQLTHMLRVMLTDVALVGKLIDITVENGVNEMNNIRFDLSKPKQHELYLQALEGATTRVKDKAEVLRKAFGIEQLKIKSINVSNSNAYSNISYAYNAGYPAAAPAPSGESDSATTITGGEIQVSATVSIVYTY